MIVPIVLIAAACFAAFILWLCGAPYDGPDDE